MLKLRCFFSLILVTSFASTIWSFSGLETSVLKEEAVLQDCTSLSELIWEPTRGEKLLSVEDREFRLYAGPDFAPLSQAKFTGGRPATAAAWSRAEDSCLGTWLPERSHRSRDQPHALGPAHHEADAGPRARTP
jgi:hypothetical protein